MQEVQRIDKVSGEGYVSPLDKIRRYIKSTAICPQSRNHYRLIWDEMATISQYYNDAPIDAIFLAFQYGMAKGYRAAKAEERQ